MIFSCNRLVARDQRMQLRGKRIGEMFFEVNKMLQSLENKKVRLVVDVEKNFVMV